MELLVSSNASQGFRFSSWKG